MHNEGNTAAVTLEAVLSKENMRAAWRAVKANQGAPGVDGRNIEETKAHLRLVGDYLRAPMQAADRRKTKRMKGTPQGGPLSPLLANIYLDPLDKELEKRGLAFVRYADDIAIFAASERACTIGLCR